MEKSISLFNGKVLIDQKLYISISRFFKFGLFVILLIITSTFAFFGVDYIVESEGYSEITGFILKMIVIINLMYTMIWAIFLESKI
jgi:hypothetical protein